MVSRLPEWPSLLSDYISQHQKAPFAWGTNDCMAFSSGLVKALTGHDFFPEFSDYSDEESAKKMLSKNGGVIGIIRKCLGSGHKNILAAKRGDIAAVMVAGEIVGGVIDDSGQRIAVVTPNGLLRLPTNKAVRIWSY